VRIEIMLLPAMSLAVALAQPAGKYVLRLHLKPGQVFDASLQVQRQSPIETGEIRERIEIGKVQNGVITVRVQITGLSINGRDRQADLNTILGKQVIEMPWTEQSGRTGPMTQLKVHAGNPEALALLGEAGLYLCAFVGPAVKPGDSWNGSTTATGGCTSGLFTLKDFSTKDGKQFAIFEITDIRMFTSTQVGGPMKMTVDMATGLPTFVSYSARDNETGRISTFEQTIAPAKAR
jgi:hypothetical protein